MVSTNIRLLNCFVDILEMEDKPEELIELLASYDFLDEDGNITRAGHDIINSNDVFADEDMDE